MARRDKKDLRKEELERENGEALPKREVMSIVSTDPGVISIPEDPTIGVERPPSDEDELVPPPRYDT